MENRNRDEHRWTWQELEPRYLAADNPRGQSGFSGDEGRWEMARRVIADCIPRGGTFLDIGCASGFLMESVVEWAGERGVRVEPYGLDASAKLAELARSRLPNWAERIYVGDALTWQPPRRFDVVRTELVYVPKDREPEYVQRLLDHFLTPGGRLLACSYGSSRRPAPLVEAIDEQLRDWGFDVGGVAEAVDPANGIPVNRVVWIETPGAKR
ncbi:MAG: methyltransferase domain-containing protein [Vicinamibacterales bacterium]